MARKQSTAAHLFQTSLAEAIASATDAATRFGLPRTVYLDEASGDWMHTNPFAPTLHRNPKHAVTMLNPNYFC